MTRINERYQAEQSAPQPQVVQLDQQTQRRYHVSEEEKEKEPRDSELIFTPAPLSCSHGIMTSTDVDTETCKIEQDFDEGVHRAFMVGIVLGGSRGRG